MFARVFPNAAALVTFSARGLCAAQHAARSTAAVSLESTFSGDVHSYLFNVSEVGSVLTTFDLAI